jgi:hypoxanthine phosphoribosyltransferase
VDAASGTRAIGTENERIARLEQKVLVLDKDLADMGGTLDHVLNTVDTIILPEQRSHSEALARHSPIVADALDFMQSTRGAWAFVQKAGIVIAALSGLVTMGLSIWRLYHGK